MSDARPDDTDTPSPPDLVGRPLYPGRTHIPPGCRYRYHDGRHVLIVVAEDVGPREVDDIARGESEFALAVHPPTLFLLWRFGRAFPWDACPFNVRAADGDQPVRFTGVVDGEPHAYLYTFLADTGSGLVRAQRRVTFSPAMTTALQLAIAAQTTNGWEGKDAYKRALRAITARYPTAEALLATAVARTRGGR